MPAVAQIKPELIRWARTRSHLTMEAASSRLKVKRTIVEAWEKGEEFPTFREAKSIAQRLHVPFGYLFLSEPPGDDLPIPDFRTISDDHPSELSTDFRDVLNDALRKQLWFKEYLEAEGENENEYVGRFSRHADWQEVAESIRNSLGLTDKFRREASGWENFLVRLVRQVEALGILVLRNSLVGNNTQRKLDVSEFRGFALSDPVAPLIFINSADAKAAQTFTLIHELAHIWINESGVSNPDPKFRSLDQGGVVEVLANRVAAETLVPSADFVAKWTDIDDPHMAIGVLTGLYRVSSLVILRSALDAELLSQAEYWSLYNSERARQTQSTATSGSFYPAFLARSSRTLTMALVASVSAERTSRLEAAKLLGVQPDTIRGIANQLAGDGGVSA